MGGDCRHVVRIRGESHTGWSGHHLPSRAVLRRSIALTYTEPATRAKTPGPHLTLVSKSEGVRGTGGDEAHVQVGQGGCVVEGPRKDRRARGVRTSHDGAHVLALCPWDTGLRVAQLRVVIEPPRVHSAARRHGGRVMAARRDPGDPCAAKGIGRDACGCELVGRVIVAKPAVLALAPCVHVPVGGQGH
eukprot:scaffold173222_cov30-Tisochrysis_lutea.AAC.1